MVRPEPLLRIRLVRRWNVFGGTRRALAEKKQFHLLHDDFLILLAGRVQLLDIPKFASTTHAKATLSEGAQLRLI